MSSEDTGINFTNEVSYTPEFNMYTYRNFYNGGGVGLGDINNDGLSDVFFCGNMVDNKLYLNKGNFQFEDITAKAGVASENVWSTGVSFVDVNGDGWLDIYICKSGRPGGERRHNELFVNNGDLSFTEMAEAYGLADVGLSSHAAFFDYDRDGDLDCYLLNNSFRPIGGFDMRPGLREIRDSLGGNKLYRNDLTFESGNPSPQTGFVDVSEEAGIYGSNIGFGLGVTIGDVNRDGWQDIFVSNDFFERDYLYINQQDGTFLEDLVNQIRETSMGSMGADMADINNDGYPEIFVTEMLPEQEARYKTKMTFENWDKYQLSVKSGYHHQFTRNVLQLNHGNNTFSEISRLANVHATDWSWSALMADLDNDGLKDIYVSNGIYKDLLDQDYINFHSNDPQILESIRNREEGAILKLIDIIPSEPIANYAFQNQGNLSFVKQTKAWGLDIPTHSNGSAYGDLDNDGDLDLVLNNSNMEAMLFQNHADSLTGNSFLQIALEGEGKNTFALGTQVSIFHNGELLYQELAPMRGFQSCVDHVLHFGLGKAEIIEKIELQWPDGRLSTLTNVPANQRLTLRQKEEERVSELRPPETRQLVPPLLRELTEEMDLKVNHVENEFVDFDRDHLLYYMLSREGPRMCKGDIDGDGLEDVFVGGASGQAGSLLIQTADGRLIASSVDALERDKASEDTDAIFFDADGDGDLDLYVCSGGNEFRGLAPQLLDRLYMNDGVGNFRKSPQKLPTTKLESTSCVRAADIDQDGDQDLFVGVRLKPGVYGIPVSSYLLLNDGTGGFEDVTESMAPGLRQLGMITDAVWTDYDKDNDPDLMVVGEWMPVSLFDNQDGKLEMVSDKNPFSKANGLWNRIKAADLDGDGDDDYVLANHGWNTRLKVSPDRPASMLVNDFDGNRTAEQIISLYNGETSYPLVLRHDLTKQLPQLKKKYLYYKDYKEQRVEDIFTEKQIRTASKSYLHTTSSSILWNEGKGKFDLKPLPVEAQFAPVYGLLLQDVNQDGRTDLLLGGNFYHAKPEVGIHDASYGLVLLGRGNRDFDPQSATESGFLVTGEIRDVLPIEVGSKQLVLVSRNAQSLMTWEILPQ
ncbi:MAG: VCBS repeat-containing protein [Bacteroidota bacterium]